MAASHLQTAIDAIDEEIAALDWSKPSYSIDGQALQWDSHRDALLKQRADLVQALIQADGPYDIGIQGWS